MLTRAEEIQLPEKLVVLIPTRNRPAYLHLTARSVLEQAARFGHKNVEIIVSDQSTPDNARATQQLVERLKKRFPNSPIHYYGPGNPPEVESLLAKATPEERKAFQELVPEKGHYGTNRNRLALLGAIHGGPNAAYLHLDDDSPLMQLVKTASGRPKIARHEEDALNCIMQAYCFARESGLPGASLAIDGVPDAYVSGSGKSERLIDVLKKPSETEQGHHYGQGRILSFDATRQPYEPYGINEDVYHAELVTRALARRITSSSYLPYQLPRKTETFMPRALWSWVLHVGVKGQAKLTGTQVLRREKITPETYEGWQKLLKRAAKQE